MRGHCARARVRCGCGRRGGGLDERSVRHGQPQRNQKRARVLAGRISIVLGEPREDPAAVACGIAEILGERGHRARRGAGRSALYLLLTSGAFKYLAGPREVAGYWCK